MLVIIWHLSETEMITKPAVKSLTDGQSSSIVNTLSPVRQNLRFLKI